MIRKRHRPKAASLMITPMIDMFTVILIFLIVSYSPEAAKIKKSDEIRLPKTDMKLTKAPRLQVEVTANQVLVNGQAISDSAESPNTIKTWKKLKQVLQEKALKDEGGKQKDEPVLIMADKDTSYQTIDSAVGSIGAAGFSEVYFLTEQEQKEGFLQ